MVTGRVARLAFLRPNSRNLAFFKVVWHNKMVLGMYVIVRQFLAFSDDVGMKKHCLAFFRTSSSFTAVGLNLYRTFSQDKGSLFSTTVPFSKIQAALPSK